MNQKVPSQLLSLKIISIIIIAFAFAAKSYISIDPDLGWHLRTTIDYGANALAPMSDPYSHTMKGYPWVDHEWLGHIILAKFLAIFSLSEMMVLSGLLFALPFAYWIFRSTSFLFILFVNLISLLIIDLVGFRAQIFSFLIFFVLVEILEHLRTKKTYLPLFVVPLLFLFWANTHASFIGGLIYVALTLVGIILSERKVTKHSLFLITILALSTLISLLNPYTIRVWIDTYYALTTPFLIYIGEWQPAILFQPVVFALSLGLLFGLLRIVWKKICTWNLLPHGFLFLSYMQHVRVGAFFYTAIMPTMRTVAAEVETLLCAHASVFVKKHYSIIVTVLAIMPLFFLSTTTTFSEVYRPPINEAASLASITKQVDGNVFNEYGFGGTMLLLDPTRKVFIDGRMPHWRDSRGYAVIDEYIDITLRENSDWQSIFQKHDIRIAFFAVTPKELTEKPVLGENEWLNRKFIQLHAWLKEHSSNDLEGMLREARWCTILKTEKAIIMTAPGEIGCKNT